MFVDFGPKQRQTQTDTESDGRRQTETERDRQRQTAQTVKQRRRDDDGNDDDSDDHYHSDDNNHKEEDSAEEDEDAEEDAGTDDVGNKMWMWQATQILSPEEVRECCARSKGTKFCRRWVCVIVCDQKLATKNKSSQRVTPIRRKRN